ncbi:hypothetical protein L1987_59091 [Smallanthus sonchifolius]|uniref:Uncharacterized protein n=1 Tax=Smallanthus sonchifolius TaxID=185202 RepID=A0ACB9D4C3_9ASTR|nr:hypothetical protein L1987_59091 [Smallanthus sonchifolius]
MRVRFDTSISCYCNRVENSIVYGNFVSWLYCLEWRLAVTMEVAPQPPASYSREYYAAVIIQTAFRGYLVSVNAMHTS